MPIKLCQKCGLKVFVEEGRPAADPFLCTRCQASQRAAQKAVNPFDETMVMAEHPVTEDADLPIAPLPEDPPPTARLTCPACGAVFSVKLPERPVRGKCPKCLRAIAVGPDGGIRLAGETAVRPKPVSPGAPEPAPRRAERPAPPAAAKQPSRIVSGVGAGPAPSRVAGKQPSRIVPGIAGGTAPAVAARRQPSRIAPGVAEGPAPAAGAEMPEDASGAEAPPEVPAETAVEESLPPPASPSKTRATASRRFPALPTDVPVPQGDGTGKIVFTVVCVCLPIVAGLTLYALRGMPAVSGLLGKAGEPYGRGLAKMGGAKTAPEGAAPKVPEASPAAAPETPPAASLSPSTPAPAPASPEAPAPPEAPPASPEPPVPAPSSAPEPAAPSAPGDSAAPASPEAPVPAPDAQPPAPDAPPAESPEPAPVPDPASPPAETKQGGELEK